MISANHQSLPGSPKEKAAFLVLDEYKTVVRMFQGKNISLRLIFRKKFQQAF